MDNQITSQWDEIKALVTELELDVHKNANGNNAAGVRVRKGLRALKSKASTLVKRTVELDKARKAVKEGK